MGNGEDDDNDDLNTLTLEDKPVSKNTNNKTNNGFHANVLPDDDSDYIEENDEHHTDDADAGDDVGDDDGDDDGDDVDAGDDDAGDDAGDDEDVGDDEDGNDEQQSDNVEETGDYSESEEEMEVDRDTLLAMTMPELREIAKSKEINFKSGVKKNEIIDMIMHALESEAN